ncbi:MAG: DUF4412 domain-containing protein [Chitinophagaceae bacterium]|nr:DUF4412 domain-containing protein [Chitinophagaceae bacterium]
MKSRFLLFLLTSIVSLTIVAQPKVINQAIVKAKTEITFPDNMNTGGSPGEGDRMVMIGGPGGMEASTTIYYKADMTKIESTSDFGNNTIITDKKNKKTTTLIEAMGRKTGFYSTDEDQKQMEARMDSVRKARRDSLEKLGLPIAQPVQPDIEYSDETKKIAGYTCKKAVIRTKGRNGEVTNETTVWYCPDFKMGEGYSMSGGRGGMMGMLGVNGLDKIEGFPMEYQAERRNGMKVHMQVTKVQLETDIADTVFEVPKGYDIKPLKDVQGDPGRVMFRMGGGN